ncbi:GYDIA family GHMP kinase [Flavobacterium sp. '19STA2R22 D10 B1']|uniref:GYDIA family GHMP kinase n=1 Tax=Flavobacterium aerium TaxID=3037261 RepID=UPI00278BCE96|nr:GYDIA family GHMP kinase [Flavobacterium sp. '19STA2R22 D10 B1']
MKKTFYSNGKLLITGEYVVLDGAEAFALPTKYGQNLIVEKGSHHQIQWKSFDQDGTIWFEDTLSYESILHKEKSEHPIKNTLTEILYEAQQLNPKFLTESEGYTITTALTFPKQWGLGTSSTLINNIGEWLEIDAFQLLNNSFGGSGYDIACAQTDAPILYQLINGLPQVSPLVFNPNFSDHIYFLYLNRKQSSKAAIAAYYNKQSRLGTAVEDINKITSKITQATTLEEFAQLLYKHEVIMSNLLEMNTIKETLFPDFTGIIKSLGAWGGDFVMVVSKESPADYFIKKGYPTLLSFKEMIL